ncbi:unnamed protein product [Soboliphyme baturini]|uniref:CACTA en-spm transposon protein n=1 Tax=Soboliphyme baturini TaxID=241478 RepID=A0A183J340_9BILA|nr:unnamed protein product [Soboliphyme baturini]
MCKKWGGGHNKIFDYEIGKQTERYDDLTSNYEFDAVQDPNSPIGRAADHDRQVIEHPTFDISLRVNVNYSCSSCTSLRNRASVISQRRSIQGHDDDDNNDDAVA